MSETIFFPDMTVRQYLEWATILPHSRELFDIQKEAGELHLLGLYIESCIYLNENTDVLDKHLTESFFHTSVTLESASSTFLTKIGNLIKWLFKVLTLPFRAVSSLLKKIFGKDSSNNKTEDQPEVDKKEKLKELSEAISDVAVEAFSAMSEELVKSLESFKDALVKTGMADEDANTKIKELTTQISLFQDTKDKQSFLQLMEKMQNLVAEEIYVASPVWMDKLPALQETLINYLDGVKAHLDNLKSGSSTDHITTSNLKDLDSIDSILADFKGNHIFIPAGDLISKIPSLETISKELATKLQEIHKNLEDEARAIKTQGMNYTGGDTVNDTKTMKQSYITASVKISHIAGELASVAKWVNGDATALINQLKEHNEKIKVLDTEMDTFLKNVQTIVGMSREDFDKGMTDPDSVLTFHAEPGKPPTFEPKKRPDSPSPDAVTPTSISDEEMKKSPHYGNPSETIEYIRYLNPLTNEQRKMHFNSMGAEDRKIHLAILNRWNEKIKRKKAK